MYERTTGFRCKAYPICDRLGNARGGCAELTSSLALKQKLTTQQQFRELEMQLTSIQACLNSIVLLLSDLYQKDM